MNTFTCGKFSQLWRWSGRFQSSLYQTFWCRYKCFFSIQVQITTGVNTAPENTQYMYDLVYRQRPQTCHGVFIPVRLYTCVCCCLCFHQYMHQCPLSLSLSFSVCVPAMTLLPLTWSLPPFPFFL